VHAASLVDGARGIHSGAVRDSDPVDRLSPVRRVVFAAVLAVLFATSQRLGTDDDQGSAIAALVVGVVVGLVLPPVASWAARKGRGE